MSEEKILDLVIIGAAAAGSAAAVYAARRNLNFVIIAKDIGGEVALSGDVQNWPGIIQTTGFELSQNFKKHVESYNVKIEEGWEVTSLKKDGNVHKVYVENFAKEKKEFTTKSNNNCQRYSSTTFKYSWRRRNERQRRNLLYCL